MNIIFAHAGLNTFEHLISTHILADNELAQTTRLYLADSGEWEDNWLFQRSKFNKIVNNSSLFGPFLDDGTSVCMLVPNPNNERDSRPTIGDVDIDLVSELSERISVKSMESSSSDSEDSRTMSIKR